MAAHATGPKACAGLALDYTTKVIERVPAARLNVAKRAAKFITSARATGALIVYVIPGGG